MRGVYLLLLGGVESSDCAIAKCAGPDFFVVGFEDRCASNLDDGNIRMFERSTILLDVLGIKHLGSRKHWVLAMGRNMH